MFSPIRPLLRNLRRAPGVPLLAAAILAVGLAANVALFSIVNRALFHPFDYREPRRLVSVEGRDRRNRPADFSAPGFEYWQRRAASFESAAVSRWRPVALTGVRNPEDLLATQVSRDMFKVLGAVPELGRTLADRDFMSGAPPAAVISDALWRRQFQGDPSLVGRQILLDGEGYTVVGVMGSRFAFPRPLFELWLPLKPEAAGDLHAWSEAVARLKPGVTASRAERELDRILAGLPPNAARPEPLHTRVQSLAARYSADYRRGPLLLWGAAGLILLIACANAASLMLVREAARMPEFAVRAALGAGRWRLALHVLGDALAPAAAAGVVGIPLASLLVRVLSLRLAGQLPIPGVEHPSLDPSSLAAALAAMALTALLSALPATMSLFRPDLAHAFHTSARGLSPSRTANRLHSGLVGLEVALAVILLVGSGLLLRSLSNVLAVNLGFQPEHVLTARVASPASLRTTSAKAAYYAGLLDGVSSIHGVRAAALVTTLPMGGIETTTSFRAEADARPVEIAQMHSTGFQSISPDYFKAIGIRLAAGRPFAETDRRGVAIISASFARKLWPGQDALGKRVSRDDNPNPGDWLTVVGVAADVRAGGPTSPPQDLLYLPYREDMAASSFTSLVIRSGGDPLALAADLRARIRGVNPDQPVSKVESMTAYLDHATATPRLHTELVSAFAAAAMLLAVSGVFAVVSYAVAQRRREIGIRSALGAGPARTAGYVFRLGLAPVAAGVLVGLAGAIALTRLLRTELYQTSPVDPLVLSSVLAVQLAAAGAACVLPAWRATRIDPATALRSD